MTEKSAAPEQPHPRAEVLVGGTRQLLGWLGLLMLVAMLLILSSGGLFLYTAIVLGFLLATSTAMTSVSIKHLDFRRQLSADRVEVGDTVDASLELLNNKNLPALWLFWGERVEEGLDVEGIASCFRTLKAGQNHTLSYRLHPTRRGLFLIGPAVLEASDPFGLVKRFVVDGEARFLTVLPRAILLGRGLPLGYRPVHEVPKKRSLFEDPSRFAGTREYHPGDGMRRIHWAATARTGKLQVKIFEPSVLQGLLLAVDMHASAYPRGESQALIELTVTTAISLAAFVMERNQSAGLLSNGSDAAESYPLDWKGGTFRRLEEALQEGATRRSIGFRPLEVEAGKGAFQYDRLRTALARLITARGPCLAELLTVELSRLPRSLVLTVLSPRPDAALSAALASLKRSGFEVALIWMKSKQDGDRTMADIVVPAGVPVYTVACEDDILNLAGQRL